MEKPVAVFLIAIVSVETTTGDHDGHCSGDECVDVEDFLEEIPVLLIGKTAQTGGALCRKYPNYLRWLVDELDLDFKKVDFGGGSGYCRISDYGLQHEMVGKVTKIHRLESTAEEPEYECYTHLDDHAGEQIPSFITEQLFTLFMCVNRLELPLCKDIRQVIRKIVSDDWFSMIDADLVI